jgi:hypothetical protein
MARGGIEPPTRRLVSQVRTLLDVHDRGSIKSGSGVARQIYFHSNRVGPITQISVT